MPQITADQRLASLLADISAYVLRLKSEITGLHHRIDAAPSADPSEPPLKKRKAVADLGTAGNEAAVDGAGTSWTGAGAAECTVADVSVSVPVRKKMRLEFMGDTGKGDGGIRAINASSGDIEAGLAWRDVGMWYCPRARGCSGVGLVWSVLTLLLSCSRTGRRCRCA